MLLGEEAYKALDDFLRRIPRGVRVVYDRIVRLGERKHDSVQAGAEPESLVKLVAEPVPVRISEKVELAVGVQQLRQVV